MRHQALLADRQQASRDLILRAHNNRKDAVVVQIHVCMLDLYEQVLATHTDYAALRTHLLDSPALRTLHDLAYKAARDIESGVRDSFPGRNRAANFEQLLLFPVIGVLDHHDGIGSARNDSAGGDRRGGPCAEFLDRLDSGG